MKSTVRTAARGGKSEWAGDRLAHSTSKASAEPSRRRRTGKTGTRAHSRPSKAPLSGRKLPLLRHTYSLIEPRSGLTGLVFYRNLFSLAPSLRSLFQTSIELQSRKLMEALSYTIATFEQPNALLPVLEALGRRHVTYGVRDEHYEIVIQAMLQTLAEMLGAEFSTKDRNAWEEALSFVAGVMKRGVQRSEAGVG